MAGYNLPEGTTGADIDNIFCIEYGDCEICGSPLMKDGGIYDSDLVCTECHTHTDLRDIFPCNGCDSKGLTMEQGERGFRVVCECGHSGSWQEKRADAVDAWNALNN